MDLVGACSVCHTSVYCRGGFLDGVTENGKLYCHKCFEAEQADQKAEKAGKAEEAASE